MTGPVKPIRFSQHALQQLAHRGASEAEVTEAIRAASWEPAELNRLGCRKTFAFNRSWNGVTYRTKQVRPIFVEELREIVVITVYVYYS